MDTKKVLKMEDFKDLYYIEVTDEPKIDGDWMELRCFINPEVAVFDDKKEFFYGGTQAYDFILSFKNGILENFELEYVFIEPFLRDWINRELFIESVLEDIDEVYYQDIDKLKNIVELFWMDYEIDEND